MRTLLYFRFTDAASARNGWTQVLALSKAPTYVTGPWFLGRGLKPIAGFPVADSSHTTFRPEVSMAGYVICAVLGIALAGNYGDHSDPLSSLTAYGLGFMIGGFGGWFLGALSGARLSRPRLARHAALLSQGEILMIVGCKSSEKDKVKTLLYGRGGVGIEEHGDFLPHLRWI
ncbi:hypothetical protein [Cupriavidus sp. D39]|uniref:hypothetical protein n=1 Tax=Cupriavidus sp. D39 TaxID=2997877 RepID=UPI00226F4E39|nr:hypothetical protein [Cupriavidus sp. D39]MCY0852938.1 hypothetical protein [Cupriavidus sp. D39]